MMMSEESKNEVESKKFRSRKVVENSIENVNDSQTQLANVEDVVQLKEVDSYK
jgi:hypothetical protein